jgi:drug/metabolite transporter (DMT)-like permease
MLSRSSVAVLLSASLSAAGGQLLFRMGAQNHTQLREFFNAPIGLGLLLYALGTALWIYALSRERLVSVYAFTALTFVLVYLAGWGLLGESVSARGALGIGLILGGLYLLAA